eukprot:TRINITY_DN657_c0_g1_i4.p1 TRINITY_DN657_c0_g1~~TRINITY_DN657_c0_g1_i4.p1  ORF type:complete len:271 (-),score=52.61 TRINITY_DN657_c0_g1_i4:47-748(-)
MKDYYTRTRCFNCLNVARNDPDRRWEFGLCDVPINVTNALTANSVRFGIRVMGNTSQATSMVLMSCILLGAGALLIAISLKMAFFRTELLDGRFHEKLPAPARVFALFNPLLSWLSMWSIALAFHLARQPQGCYALTSPVFLLVTMSLSSFGLVFIGATAISDPNITIRVYYPFMFMLVILFYVGCSIMVVDGPDIAVILSSISFVGFFDVYLVFKAEPNRFCSLGRKYNDGI